MKASAEIAGIYSKETGGICSTRKNLPALNFNDFAFRKIFLYKRIVDSLLLVIYLRQNLFVLSV